MLRDPINFSRYAVHSSSNPNGGEPIEGEGFRDWVRKGKKIVNKVVSFVKSDNFSHLKNAAITVGQLTGKMNPNVRTGFPGELHAIGLSGKDVGMPYSFAGERLPQ